MNKTKIEWVKNPDGTQGYTWNPITGCLNGCEYCYARKLANGRLKSRYLANSILPTHDEPNHQAHHNDAFYPRLWPTRLEELQPIGGLVTELVYPPKTRKGIFVCDMSDLFGTGIPDEWTLAVLKLIKKWPAHRFYLLTKQPQNLIKFSPFPDNCWVGVTITNNHTWLGPLVSVEAKVKYLSFEPLLKWGRFETQKKQLWDILGNKLGISWVIIGAQTKPTVMPKIEWVREIVQACDKAGVKVFLKDSLLPLLKTQGIGNNISWKDKTNASGFEPLHLELRQEVPK